MTNHTNKESETRIYPCDKCGTMRSKAEGGTVFTVCDDCWDAKHSPTTNKESETLEAARDFIRRRYGPPENANQAAEDKRRAVCCAVFADKIATERIKAEKERIADELDALQWNVHGVLAEYIEELRGKA